MVIKAIYEIASNRDGYNFRIRPMGEGKHEIGETMNIQLYNKANTVKEVHAEIKKGFKYGYDNRTGERKHHKGISTSFYYEM